jgi:hypothetical protein
MLNACQVNGTLYDFFSNLLVLIYLWYRDEFLGGVTVQEGEANRHSTTSKRKCEQTVPSDYHLKYEHLLGKSSAKDAAQATSANRSYGFGKCRLLAKHVYQMFSCKCHSFFCF